MDTLLVIWFFLVCAGLLYAVVVVTAVALWQLPKFLRWLLWPPAY